MRQTPGRLLSLSMRAAVLVSSWLYGGEGSRIPGRLLGMILKGMDESGAATLHHRLVGFWSVRSLCLRDPLGQACGAGKERSGSGKIFERCVDSKVHLHDFFNDCPEFWTDFQACGRIFA